MVTLKLLIPASALLLLMACGKELPVNAQNNKDAVKQPAAPQAVAGGGGSVFKGCADCPEMVVIPAGSFEMGAATKYLGMSHGEAEPAHRVTLRSFSMGKTEITQGQWRAIMGSNPSQFSKCGDNCPVEDVSWDDVQAFVKKLNEKTGKNYRLPSEAEWEYAIRAGSQTNFSFGANEDNEGESSRYAWFVGNSGNKTHPVGEKLPNAFGLHDMHGNVGEWTQDCWNFSYKGAPTDGSAWMVAATTLSGSPSAPAKTCLLRVVRGGSWDLNFHVLRSSSRSPGFAGSRYTTSVGFRVASTD